MIEQSLCNATRSFLLFLLKRRVKRYPDDQFRRPTVVFAPHPDDETLACGGTIIKKTNEGSTVDLVFVTDGSKSHPKLMPPQEMKVTREKEALAAASILGVERQAVHFLHFEDRELQHHFEAAVEAVLRILNECGPEEVFLPYPLEAPRDHRATNVIVKEALNRYGKAVTVYEYPVWMWQHCPWTCTEAYRLGSRRAFIKEQLVMNFYLLKDFQCAVNIGDVLARKRSALDQHRSQMIPLVDDPRWKTLPDMAEGKFLKCFFRPFELFHAYEVPGADPVNGKADSKQPGQTVAS